MSDYYSEFGTKKKKRRSFWLWFLDVVITLLSTVVAVAMILTLIVPYVHPDHAWYLPVLGLGAPAIYVVNVICFLFWVVRWRLVRASVMLVLTVLGFFNVSVVYQPEIRKHYETKYPRRSIKVMTYNVRSFYDDRGQSSVDSVVSLITREKPQVVCLQEFNKRLANQSEAFAELRKKYKTVYFGRISKRDTTCSVPLCVLSNFRLLRSGVIESPKSSVWVDLEWNNDTLRVFNNHLHSTAINAKDDDFLTNGLLEDSLREEKVKSMFRRFCDNSVLRASQVDTIAQVIHSTKTRHLVMGDFNDTPVSYVYREMSQGLEDTFCEMGTGCSHTYRGFFNTLRIDYIFRSAGLATLSYEVLDVNFSDHRPIVVRFEKL